MKTIRYHPEARAEFIQAIAVYEEQREGRGIKFRRAVEKGEADIQAAPDAWAKYKRTKYREYIVRRFPYAIYFEELADSIVIVAVAHGKRRSGYWRKRES